MSALSFNLDTGERYPEFGHSGADDYGGIRCDRGEFVFVGDGQHDVETGGTVQEDGLENACVN